MQQVSLWLAFAATLLVPALYMGSSNHWESAASASFAGIGWLGYYLIRNGRYQMARIVMIAGVYVLTILSVLAFGSIRSGSNFLFVGVVVGGSLFLNRTGLRVLVALCIAALGVLTLAESEGLLGQVNFDVGLKTWLTQVACLIVVALLVFRGRDRSERLTDRMRQELVLRRITEQERDRNLDRFARIFRSNPSPMLAQSAITGSILDVNQAFERCYGYTRDQVLGRNDAFLWADEKERSDYLKELFSKRRPGPRSVKGLRSDGTRFDAQVSSELGDDPDDQLVITTIADVTDQNRALEKLRRSEERFAKAFNFSPLNMTISRLSDGTYLEVNGTEDGLLGLSSDEMRGMRSVDVGTWLTPEDRKQFVDQLLKDGHISAYDTRMRHRDGHFVDTRIWAELVDIGGERCILACHVNTTEEKRREGQLIELAKGLSGATGTALLSALSHHMAQAMEASLVAVLEVDDTDGRELLACWAQADIKADDCFVDQPCTPCDHALATTEVCIFPRNLGQLFSAHPAIQDNDFQAFAGQSLRDDRGRVIGLLMAVWRQPVDPTPAFKAMMSIFSSRASAELLRLQRDREIAELNATLERRVIERTAELVKLNAELDSFAYSVSHDLKSPLRHIEGFTQLLAEELDGRLSQDERLLLDRVLAATTRMSKLIADLLALTRISQGTLNRQSVDLTQMARESIAATMAQLPGRAIRWEVEEGMRCDCDPRLARIALDNLLGNAAKYTRDTPQPLVRMGHVLHADGSMPTDGVPSFFIEDNGAGFDMRFADKLFKPFQRLHMPSSGFDGTGIGLATVHRVMERHGGQIRGEATVGRGARFEFSFGTMSGNLEVRAATDASEINA